MQALSRQAGTKTAHSCPDRDCRHCPRLAEFRDKNRQVYPNFFNGPVPSFGANDAQFLVVGLAPGLKGANQTGRPFTGDYAGDVLYEALLRHGFAQGNYQARANDGMELANCRITNAVRCVPPENKPTPQEIKTCLGFLRAELENMPNLSVILSLGRISHEAVLRATGTPLKTASFGHGALHQLQINGRVVALLDSYHSSRYNIQTNRLTREMFSEIIATVRRLVDQTPRQERAA